MRTKLKIAKKLILRDCLPSSAHPEDNEQRGEVKQKIARKGRSKNESFRSPWPLDNSASGAGDARKVKGVARKRTYRQQRESFEAEQIQERDHQDIPWHDSIISHPGAFRVSVWRDQIPETDDAETIVVGETTEPEESQEKTDSVHPFDAYISEVREVDAIQTKAIRNPEAARSYRFLAAAVFIVSAALLSSIALGLTLGIIRASSKSVTAPSTPITTTASPTASPVTRSSLIHSALETKWNGTRPWTVTGSSQFEAYKWLTSVDTFDIKNLTGPQLLERYALAVLYYSAFQPQDRSGSLNYFLRPVSVCDWNPIYSTSLTSITCASDGFVKAVQLSK